MNRAFFYCNVAAICATLIGVGSAVACEPADPHDDPEGYREWCLCIGGTPTIGSYGGPACIPPSGGAPSVQSRPPGSVPCSTGGYCDRGYYCANNGHSCLPNGSVDCGTYYCPSGNACGRFSSGCVPPHSVECSDGGLCGRGNHCSKDGHRCVPDGASECSDGRYCKRGEECGPGDTCQPGGTAQKRERVNQIKAQLRDLDNNIRGWIDHIVDAGQATYGAKRAIEEWVGKKEEAQKEALRTAVGRIPELIRDQLLEFAHWHTPPANAGRLKKTLVDFASRLGITFRNVELSNRRFLWYAHELWKGLSEEDLARHGVTHDEYLHALGAIAEASIAFTPESFPKHLIAVGVADIDIWSADFHAYWISIEAVWSVNRELDIQAHDLKQMASWSRLLHHDMEERRRLLAECRQLLFFGWPASVQTVCQ